MYSKFCLQKLSYLKKLIEKTSIITIVKALSLNSYAVPLWENMYVCMYYGYIYKYIRA